MDKEALRQDTPNANRRRRLESSEKLQRQKKQRFVSKAKRFFSLRCAVDNIFSEEASADEIFAEKKRALITERIAERRAEEQKHAREEARVKKEERADGEAARDQENLARKRAGEVSLPSQRLFNVLELFSRILPAKVRRDSFEPAYNDEKKDYLHSRHIFKSKPARRWLAFWFALHVSLMVGQCLWGMCSGSVKRFLTDWFTAVLKR
jgi:hypothetical protein